MITLQKLYVKHLLVLWVGQTALWPSYYFQIHLIMSKQCIQVQLCGPYCPIRLSSCLKYFTFLILLWRICSMQWNLNVKFWLRPYWFCLRLGLWLFIDSVKENIIEQPTSLVGGKLREWVSILSCSTSFLNFNLKILLHFSVCFKEF